MPRTAHLMGRLEPSVGGGVRLPRSCQHTETIRSQKTGEQCWRCSTVRQQVTTGASRHSGHPNPAENDSQAPENAPDLCGARLTCLETPIFLIKDPSLFPNRETSALDSGFPARLVFLLLARSLFPKIGNRKRDPPIRSLASSVL